MATRRVSLSDGWVDLERRVVHRGGRDASLTAVEGSLLAHLVAQVGRDVPRDELHAEVWGHAPDVVSRAVDHAVGRLRRKIEPEPARPRHLITAHGIGYRFVAAEESAAAVPRPRCVPHVRELKSFVGRESELGELGRLLAGDGRLVTLLGPAGVGKSRLARRFARRVEEDEPGRVVRFVELWRDGAEADVVHAVADGLGLPAHGSRDEVAASAAEVLGATDDALLVLDGAEPHVDAVVGATFGWLAGAPSLRVLVTSQHRLGVEGEVCMPLGPLSREDAATLFRDRARAIRPSAALAPAEVGRLVDALDRLPLEIELAAGRSGILGVAELTERLSSRLDLLSTTGGGAASLRAAIESSWQLLDAVEQRVLASAAVFRGGFTPAAAEQVLGASDVATSLLDTLQSLGDKSLLTATDAPRGVRLGMLESVRAFAEERLAASDERPDIERRHARYFVDALSGDVPLAEAARERDNLAAAHTRFSGSTDPDDAALCVRAALALARVLLAHGPTGSLREALDGGLAAARAAGLPELGARVLLRRSELRLSQGDAAGAEADALEAASLEPAGPHRIALGNVRRRERHFAEAARLFREAAAAATSPVEGGTALRHLGVLELDFGNVADARVHLEEAHRSLAGVVAAELSSLLGMDRAIAGLEAGLDAEPGELFEQCIATYVAAGDRRREAHARSNLGVLHHRHGRLAEARRSLEHALDLLEHIGAPRFEGYALGALGFLDHEEGRLDDAGRRQTAALDKLGRAADRRFEAISLARLGAVRAESGEPEDARELFRRARAMFADASETWWLPAVDVLQLIAQPSARTSRVEGAADAPGDGAFAAIARRVLASARARASTG